MIEAGPHLVLAVLCLHAGGFVLGYLAGRLWLRREKASRLERLPLEETSRRARRGGERGASSGEPIDQLCEGATRDAAPRAATLQF